MKRSILRGLAFTVAVVVVLLAQSKPGYSVPVNNQTCSFASTDCPCVPGNWGAFVGCYPYTGDPIYQCQASPGSNCTPVQSRCLALFRPSNCTEFVVVPGGTPYIQPVCYLVPPPKGAPLKQLNVSNCNQ